jgi:hypothetical protein
MRVKEGRMLDDQRAVVCVKRVEEGMTDGASQHTVVPLNGTNSHTVHTHMPMPMPIQFKFLHHLQHTLDKSSHSLKVLNSKKGANFMK